ncbi:MAG: hypothetical protein GX173_05690 [Ruminococcaceae bacterium]|jgi:nitroreductase|nr:hypothetical protein [Oscillospiraceae bacterium]
MNTTIQAILDRRSIRDFTAEGLTQVEIDTLIDVALASPTAMNRQQWVFRFITDKDLIEQLNQAAQATFRENGDQEVLERIASRHTSIFYGAPLVVMIAVPKAHDTAVDAGIAVQNLAIAAQSMGLGSCIIGMASAAFSGPNGQDMLGRMDWPDDYEFVISIAIGHPATSKEAHEEHPEKVQVI